MDFKKWLKATLNVPHAKATLVKCSMGMAGTVRHGKSHGVVPFQPDPKHSIEENIGILLIKGSLVGKLPRYGATEIKRSLKWKEGKATETKTHKSKTFSDVGVSLLWHARCLVTWQANYHVKGCIPQNVCWNLGGGEVFQTLKHDTVAPKTTTVQFHTGKISWNSLAYAQCNVAAWKPIASSFVLHRAGNDITSSERGSCLCMLWGGRYQ